MKESQETPNQFAQYIDLASEKIGGKVLSCSDDFFAEKENLIKPGRGIFIEDKYTDRGKWMDGWESRRKRDSGHDWCILRLGVAGKIRGVDIDTNHFLGNHPPHASIEACFLDTDSDQIDWSSVEWHKILDTSHLDPGSQNLYEIESTETWNCLRLNIYPDGGVARLKVYGEVDINWDVLKNKSIDLAAAVHGGQSIECNDMFFSSKDNIIMPGRGINMGDGWETKRNRTPGNVDWLIIQLGHKGLVESIMVDTIHFKGNFPDTCSIEGCCTDDSSTNDLNAASWTEILPQSKLSADSEHYFKGLKHEGPYTHIKLKIYPDGGVSRLRIIGKPV